MIESARGIILRTRPLTETSLIVQWLTPGHGRIATVAKGARRTKSSFAGKLDLFYEAEFSFARSRRSELHTLREIKLIETHPALRNDLALLQQAAYAARLIEQTTEIETPLPAFFKLLGEFLSRLPAQPARAQNAFAFELKLLRELGLAPDLSQSKLNPGSRLIVEKLSDNDWPELARLKLSTAQEKEIQQFLHGYLVYHLGKIPKNRTSALNLS